MHFLALRLAWSHLKTRPISRLAVIFSVSCVLFVSGVIFLMFQSFSQTLAEIRSAQYVTVYIDPAVTVDRESEVVSAVKKIPGVGSVQLVSKDAFLQNFAKVFPQLAAEVSSLDVDAIPRYAKVQVTLGAALDRIREQLTQVRGVEQVELNTQKFSSLIRALSLLRKLSLALLAGLTIALGSILLNHFKLGSALQTQMRHTMTVLGARRLQIFLPFLIEGSVEGVIAGLLAGGALLFSARTVEMQFNHLFSGMGYHPYRFDLTIVAMALVGAGVLTGVLGSFWAASRVRK